MDLEDPGALGLRRGLYHAVVSYLSVLVRIIETRNFEKKGSVKDMLPGRDRKRFNDGFCISVKQVCLCRFSFCMSAPDQTKFECRVEE